LCVVLWGWQFVIGFWLCLWGVGLFFFLFLCFFFFWFLVLFFLLCFFSFFFFLLFPLTGLVFCFPFAALGVGVGVEWVFFGGVWVGFMFLVVVGWLRGFSRVRGVGGHWRWAAAESKSAQRNKCRKKIDIR